MNLRYRQSVAGGSILQRRDLCPGFGMHSKKLVSYSRATSYVRTRRNETGRRVCDRSKPPPFV